ncbi:DUF6232 family protein [Azospirillum sp. A1-3]|uniref:DUF6232 family protein n=1 Tax=Azospirillum sp. A1-3 TaxID=185874 RepID=UPI0020772E1D|nr:DUF6232 family protein [Azospirillum sp. A1-3]MCM8736569.1 DUF6232 family protein [Azospirillum sp. A1-3]
MNKTDVIYSSGGTRVTTTLVEIAGTTYAVQSIGSVRIAEIPKSGGGGAALLAFIGGGLLVLGLFAALGGGGGMSLGMMLVGALLCIPAVQHSKRPPEYALTLATASGDRQALTSTDRSALSGIRSAIEKAMASAREVRPAADVHPPAPPPTDDTKICPRCAETIKAAAVVCRYCNHEFSPSLANS